MHAYVCYQEEGGGPDQPGNADWKKTKMLPRSHCYVE